MNIPKSCSCKGIALIEVLITFAIVGMLLTIIVGGHGCANASHGNGEKIGQVVKLSKQGFVRATWEGQLIRGGMSGGSGTLGTVPFDFTVEGEELVKKVQAYMRDQTEVIISYRIEGLYSPFRSESGGHFLISIEPVKPEKK